MTDGLKLRHETPTDDRPWHGSACPNCGNGILYAVGQNDDGVLLRCFNCDTQGTVHATDPWVDSVAAGEDANTAPAGFTRSHTQRELQAAGGDPNQVGVMQRREQALLAETERQTYENRIAQLQAQLQEREQQQPPPGEGGGQ